MIVTSLSQHSAREWALLLERHNQEQSRRSNGCGASGKQVALDFSNAPLPRDFDEAQYNALKKYQEDRKQDSLVWDFSNATELKGLFVTQASLRRWRRNWKTPSR